MNWDYAAGFLDADGSLGFVHEYGSKRLRLSATQITRPVLEELQQVIGLGQIYERPSGRRNNMNTERVLYVYLVGGFKIVPCLRELEPRLIVKKSVCREMIEYAEWRCLQKNFRKDLVSYVQER